MMRKGQVLKYYLTNVEIKDYNGIIYGKNFLSNQEKITK